MSPRAPVTTATPSPWNRGARPADALDHGGAGGVADGASRVAHGRAVGGPGCRDSECCVAVASEVLDKELERGADDFDGRVSRRTESIRHVVGVAGPDTPRRGRVVSVLHRKGSGFTLGPLDPNGRPRREQRGRVAVDIPHDGIRASDSVPAAGALARVHAGEGSGERDRTGGLPVRGDDLRGTSNSGSLPTTYPNPGAKPEKATCQSAARCRFTSSSAETSSSDAASARSSPS